MKVLETNILAYPNLNCLKARYVNPAVEARVRGL